MNAEDLKKYDIILLLDKSGSMGIKLGNSTRWKVAQEATVALARKCMEFDDDGITVIPFAGNFKEYKNVDGGDEIVNKIFNENEPGGSTDTAKVLKHVIDGYFAGKASGEGKPIIVICVTDGEPTDEKALIDVIVAATKKMQADEEIGISFLQIGNDPSATKFLKMLDDDLESKYKAAFDIVDTKTFDEIEESGMTLTEVVIQAITD